jgi:hypothetical protein
LLKSCKKFAKSLLRGNPFVNLALAWELFSPPLLCFLLLADILYHRIKIEVIANEKMPQWFLKTRYPLFFISLLLI